MYPNEPAFVMPKCLEEMVKAGKLGRKSGEGFYKWSGNKKI
jgi:3-hydroxyacyl-CoA dehydrogenase